MAPPHTEERAEAMNGAVNGEANGLTNGYMNTEGSVSGSVQGGGTDGPVDVSSSLARVTPVAIDNRQMFPLPGGMFEAGPCTRPLLSST